MTLKQITKSKIVCTLGPATSTFDQIKMLSERGMDVARLNFSHGTIEDKRKLFSIIRSVDPMLAIMCDIQGPKIRLGNIEGQGIMLTANDEVTITGEDIVGNGERFTISYKNLISEAKAGDLIYINDGLVCLRVDETRASELRCTVVVGGLISSKKGVNLPSTDVSIRVPTEKDEADLKVIAELDPEYLAISFVKDDKDVRKIREILEGHGNDGIKLVAKIERPVALKNYDAILKESDAIMVARGDLGVEVPFEKVIPEQKRMIVKANTEGKPVIVATQMLESMINAPVPTRAEVSDVFNAIEDGADAVMLSAETAAGKYPFKAVETMEKIIRVSESQIPPRNPDDFDSADQTTAEIIGHLAHASAKEFRDIYHQQNPDLPATRVVENVKVIVLTASGLSARMVSKYRPLLPIIGVTGNLRTAREMRMVWGVEPVVIAGIDMEPNTFKKVQQSVRACLDQGYLDENEQLIVAGNMMYLPARTNMVALFRVKDVIESMA